MIAPIVHFKTARQPPLYGQILSDGAPVDLTGDTVTFYMRDVKTSTLKVSGAEVTIDTAAQGLVHYNWQAADVDTEAIYVGWWRVALPGGQYEESPEFIVQIIDHDAESNEYVSVEELKTTRQIGRQFMDMDVRSAVVAASRAVDGYCGQHFYLGATETRLYTATSKEFLYIDPVAAITNVSLSGTTLVQNTDYAVSGFAPWHVLRSLTGTFTVGGVNAISVTGQFGWPSVPPEVKSATTMLAGRIVQMQREGGMLGLTFDGGAVPIGLFDRNLQGLLAPYKLSNIGT